MRIAFNLSFSVYFFSVCYALLVRGKKGLFTSESGVRREITSVAFVLEYPPGTTLMSVCFLPFTPATIEPLELWVSVPVDALKQLLQTFGQSSSNVIPREKNKHKMQISRQKIKKK